MSENSSRFGWDEVLVELIFNQILISWKTLVGMDSDDAIQFAPLPVSEMRTVWWCTAYRTFIFFEMGGGA